MDRYRRIVGASIWLWLLSLSWECAPQELGEGGHVGGRRDVEGLARIQRIQARFANAKMQSMLLALLYSLGHCAPQEEAEEAILAVGLPQDGPAEFSAMDAVKRAGGVEAYRKRVAALLKSKDVVVRGFGAVWLGVLGEKESVGDLLVLLRSKDLPLVYEFGRGIDRGGAARALGLLRATDYRNELVKLLESRNAFIRSNAALGLGYMRATECAPAIARLLADSEDDVQVGAVYALAEMGARDRAGDIALLLREDVSRHPEVQKWALYALVKLGAKQHAEDIAPLLEDAFTKETAALALALMGAQEYVAEIAGMLADTNPLTRSHALLALGMMRATRYEDEVAKHLQDSEEFVRGYAAWAIVMMESRKHASQALGIAEKSKHVLSLQRYGCGQIALESFRQAFDRAEESLKRMEDPP